MATWCGSASCATGRSWNRRSMPSWSSRQRSSRTGMRRCGAKAGSTGTITRKGVIGPSPRRKLRGVSHSRLSRVEPKDVSWGRRHASRSSGCRPVDRIAATAQGVAVDRVSERALADLHGPGALVMTAPEQAVGLSDGHSGQGQSSHWRPRWAKRDALFAQLDAGFRVGRNRGG